MQKPPNHSEPRPTVCEFMRSSPPKISKYRVRADDTGMPSDREAFRRRHIELQGNPPLASLAGGDDDYDEDTAQNKTSDPQSTNARSQQRLPTSMQFRSRTAREALLNVYAKACRPATARYAFGIWVCAIALSCVGIWQAVHTIDRTLDVNVTTNSRFDRVVTVRKPFGMYSSQRTMDRTTTSADPSERHAPWMALPFIGDAASPEVRFAYKSGIVNDDAAHCSSDGNAQDDPVFSIAMRLALDPQLKDVCGTIARFDSYCYALRTGRIDDAQKMRTNNVTYGLLMPEYYRSPKCGVALQRLVAEQARATLLLYRQRAARQLRTRQDRSDLSATNAYLGIDNAAENNDTSRSERSDNANDNVIVEDLLQVEGTSTAAADLLAAVSANTYRDVLLCAIIAFAASLITLRHAYLSLLVCANVFAVTGTSLALHATFSSIIYSAIDPSIAVNAVILYSAILSLQASLHMAAMYLEEDRLGVKGISTTEMGGAKVLRWLCTVGMSSTATSAIVIATLFASLLVTCFRDLRTMDTVGPNVWCVVAAQAAFIVIISTAVATGSVHVLACAINVLNQADHTVVTRHPAYRTKDKGLVEGCACTILEYSRIKLAMERLSGFCKTAMNKITRQSVPDDSAAPHDGRITNIQCERHLSAARRAQVVNSSLITALPLPKTHGSHESLDSVVDGFDQRMCFVQINDTTTAIPSVAIDPDDDDAPVGCGGAGGCRSAIVGTPSARRTFARTMAVLLLLNAVIIVALFTIAAESGYTTSNSSKTTRNASALPRVADGIAARLFTPLFDTVMLDLVPGQKTYVCETNWRRGDHVQSVFDLREFELHIDYASPNNSGVRALSRRAPIWQLPLSVLSESLLNRDNRSNGMLSATGDSLRNDDYWTDGVFLSPFFAHETPWSVLEGVSLRMENLCAEIGNACSVKTISRFRKGNNDSVAEHLTRSSALKLFLLNKQRGLSYNKFVLDHVLENGSTSIALYISRRHLGDRPFDHSMLQRTLALLSTVLDNSSTTSIHVESSFTAEKRMLASVYENISGLGSETSLTILEHKTWQMCLVACSIGLIFLLLTTGSVAWSVLSLLAPVVGLWVAACSYCIYKVSITMEAFICASLIYIAYSITATVQTFFYGHNMRTLGSIGNVATAVAMTLSTTRIVSHAAVCSAIALMSLVVMNGASVLVRQAATMLVTAVVTDAILVRFMLLPSLSILLGKAAWWPRKVPLTREEREQEDIHSIMQKHTNVTIVSSRSNVF